MEVEAQAIARENFERWTIDPEYEIVPERGIPRLTKYKKAFDEDVLVKKDGAPLMMKAAGKFLRACDVLPERADLALDSDGNLLPQGVFHTRYEEWLSSFSYPEGHDTNFDPVPEASKYVSEIQDRFSESSGWVEQYFDPKLDQEWTPAENAGTDGFTAEEKAGEATAAVTGKIMEVLAAKLTPEQAADVLQSMSVPVIGDPDAEIETASEAEARLDAAPVTPAAKEVLIAPCGKPCKGNAGLVSHKRFCAHELCGGESENTTRGSETA